MTASRYRIILADDHPAMIRCTEELLPGDFEVVATAADGQEAVDLASALHPDAVILDVMMPRMSGIEAAARISRLDPPPRIVFLTICEDSAYVEAATRAGAAAYVLKRRMATNLVPALRGLFGGGGSGPESGPDRAQTM
jgi:DNA-binding NarL/FixJ family response regulator